MALWDHATIRWPQDSTRVNTDDPVELMFWARRFHCSKEYLKHVVRMVGNHFCDVECLLDTRRS